MFAGILTKILLGVIAALVLVSGYTYVKYNWFEKPAMVKEIANLKNERTELMVEKEKQQTEIDRLKTKVIVKRRVTSAQANVGKTLNDSGAVHEFFRMRRTKSVPNPANAGKGGS